MGRMQGLAAVVTGGARGIGEGIVRRYVAEGARCVIADIDIEAGDRLAMFAGHDDGCQIMTHGVWSDPTPCTCGYTTIINAWKELGS